MPTRVRETSLTETIRLPRLLYIGDIPVEESFGGSVLLYRLLQNYPADRLRIVQGNLLPSKPELRLPSVAYEKLNVGTERLLRSRVTPIYTAYLHARSAKRTAHLERTAKDFGAEGILTVAHLFAWETAAAVADRLGLPLHLIVHDDWPNLAPILPNLKAWLHRRFATVYRNAATRFCISPYMVEEYQSRYGAKGTVLYPLRSRDVPELALLPRKANGHKKGPVFAYFGQIHGGGDEEPLKLLATVLEGLSGQLIIYGNLTDSDLAFSGLKRANICSRPHTPFKQLSEVLVEEADALVLSMSFLESKNIRVNFPSKLTDYTAMGLPILICGPAYGSGVRWAKENPGVAEVVDQFDRASLEEAVKRLVGDHSYRSSLARTAYAKGAEYFSHHEVTQQFYRALRAGQACASS